MDVKSIITKILNSEDNSKRKVPNQLTKIKSSTTSNEWITIKLIIDTRIEILYLSKTCVSSTKDLSVALE